MPVARNIRYCRTKANLTQQAFADAIGVSKSTVTSWERKKTSASINSIKMVADYFGIGFIEFCDIDLEKLEQGLSDNPIRLTPQEEKSVLMFRQLPDDIKAMIRFAITSAYQRNCEGASSES